MEGQNLKGKEETMNVTKDELREMLDDITVQYDEALKKLAE